MRWRNRDESSNVEDRRGSRGPRGLPGLPVGMMRGPGIIIVLLVIVAGSYFGVDFTPMLTGEMEPGSSQPYTATPEEQELARFTSVVLKTTEETWGELFQEMGKTYQQPRLVMYTGATSTTCGYGQAAMGPFYCPEDETVYIDLSFYQDMKNKLGGGGDFAQGYVIAHEVGHHVQHLLGIEPQVRRLQQGASRSEANRLSVMLELQADCFAGVWGRAMEDQGILESGDLQEALRTAQAIGDDRLQKQTQGYVVPDSFTHGTSQQRYAWFRRGFDSGDPGCCNTFKEMGHALNSAIVGNCN